MPFRLDRFTIDSHELVGQRLRVDGFLSRTGVQIYDQGNGTIRREQRDASEVFSGDALASLRAMPITIGHPSNVMLDSSNWRSLSHGHVGDDVRPADDGVHTTASLWILDGSTQKSVIDGELTELSVGYFAELDETPGVNDRGERFDARQINIRGNHLALLRGTGSDRARGGPGCKIRLDSNGNASYDVEIGRDPEERKKMKLKIRADGYDHEVEADSDVLAVALEKERKSAQEIVDGMKKTIDELKAKLDAEADKAKDLEAKLDSAPKLTSDVIDAAIQLRKDAELVAGKDLESDLDGLKRAALEAKGVDLEGRSDAYVEARFDAELEIAKARPGTNLAEGRKIQVEDSDDDDVISLANILSDRLAGEGE